MSADYKARTHKLICESLHTTYLEKNADYGDSFSKVRQEYPEAIIIRLMDKLNRLQTLIGGDQAHVKDEPIDDTLLDMANYCILELVERKAAAMAAAPHLDLDVKEDPYQRTDCVHYGGGAEYKICLFKGVPAIPNECVGCSHYKSIRWKEDENEG